MIEEEEEEDGGGGGGGEGGEGEEEEETTKKSRKCSLVLKPHNRKERARYVFKWNGYSPCFHVIENEAPLSSLPCEDKKKIGISFLVHSIPTKFSSLLFICFHKNPYRTVHCISAYCIRHQSTIERRRTLR